jgi:hypothetical protein
MTRLYEALPTQFPRVKMVTWFCVDAVGTGLASNNYALTCSPAFMERYRQLVDNSYFLGRMPDVSEMVASLPPLAEPVATEQSEAFGPLEIPDQPEPEPEPEPAPEPAADAPPTDHPLALAHLGAVGPDDLDVAVVGAPPTALTGEVEVRAEPGADVEVDVIAFYVDGEWRAITNARPYRYPWDTSYEEPGVHEIKAVGMNEASLPVIETTVSVVVAEQ